MNILVTGASRGIGNAIAKELEKNGFNVFAVARNEALLKDFQKYCVADIATDAGL